MKKVLITLSLLACTYWYPNKGSCTYQTYASYCQETDRWVFSVQKPNGGIKTMRIWDSAPYECWEQVALQWGCFSEKCQGRLKDRSCPHISANCWDFIS